MKPETQPALQPQLMLMGAGEIVWIVEDSSGTLWAPYSLNT